MPAASADGWTASWIAPQQRVWQPDFVLPAGIPYALDGHTVRQTLRLSSGGRRLRLVLGNRYGSQPVHIGKTTVRRADGKGSLKTVRFNGKTAALIPAGGTITSDPVALAAPDLAVLETDIYLPQHTPLHTFHWDGRQTAYIAKGELNGKPFPTDAAETTARLLLAAVQVENAEALPAVAVLGDSITDGNAATLNQNTRWPDYLAERLAPRRTAVINAGISGARLLSDGMSEKAAARLEADVFAQPNVKTLIVLLGINDIAHPGTLFAPKESRPTLDRLAAGYRRLTAQAHARGIRVIAATLPPFAGALPDTPLDNYYHPEKDELRRRFNQWIRQNKDFDGVIDFDTALRDPEHPDRLNPAYDSGDHLHPGDAGSRAMAEAVDLDMLAPPSAAQQP